MHYRLNRLHIALFHYQMDHKHHPQSIYIVMHYLYMSLKTTASFPSDDGSQLPSNVVHDPRTEAEAVGRWAEIRMTWTYIARISERWGIDLA